MVLGDVIYPAFLDPYVVKWFMPLAGLAALGAEFAVYGAFYRRAGLVFLLVVVLGANLVSSIAGVGLALLLPTGLVHTATSTVRTQSPAWLALASLAWPLALVASIAIEHPILLLATRTLKLRRLFGSVCVANAASYIVLYAITRVVSG